MDTSNSKLEHANVVAVFDTMHDANRGLMGLRIAGFPDRRVGYFSRAANGPVMDLIGRSYTVTGAVIGGLVGAGLGLWAGWMVQRWQGTPVAPPLVPAEASASVVLLACALWGAVLFSLIGASIGWCCHRRDAVHLGSEMEPGRYVMAVDAGDRKDEAWSILRHYGARDPLPEDGLVIPEAPHAATPA